MLKNSRNMRIEALSSWLFERLTPGAAAKLKRFPSGKTARAIQRIMTLKAVKEWRVSKSTAALYAQLACLLVSTKLINSSSAGNASSTEHYYFKA